MKACQKNWERKIVGELKGSRGAKNENKKHRKNCKEKIMGNLLL